jgi:hypothetical protein
MRAAASVGAALAAMLCTTFAGARELSITIGDVQAPGVSARALRANLSGPRLDRLKLEIGELKLAGYTRRDVSLACRALQSGQGRLACAAGVIDIGTPLPVSFSYDTRRGDLRADIEPGAGEALRLTGRLAGGARELRVVADNIRLERANSWLPDEFPQVNAGRANGTIAWKNDALDANIAVSGAGFSDPAGLRAGEKLSARLAATGRARDGGHEWEADLSWAAGEVFWKPLFVAAAGQVLRVRAVTRGGTTRVAEGRFELPGIGTLHLAGVWDHEAGRIRAFDAEAERLDAAPFFDTLLRPPLQETALAEADTTGEFAFRVSIREGALHAFALDLADISVSDRRGRYAVTGLTGHIPWERQQTSAGSLSVKEAELLRVPVGTTRIAFTLRERRIDVAEARVPLLDGALVLRDFAAGLARDGWRWRFSGRLEPVSMAELTRALELPVMHGTLSGAIPEVRFRRRSVEMDGALELRAFDGTVHATSVQLTDAFGAVPQLYLDLTASGLDLELLTRTFDFGTVTGRIDAKVSGIELVAWRPVRFDARVESSPGRYPRRISQRAVENISALGGAGAAAALQRTFLRFFDQFGYARIGLSCRLENDVCEMDGIRRVGEGFVIVEGGGIPAVTVVGYNRRVDWPELIDRLRRVTQDNLKPIVK